MLATRVLTRTVRTVNGFTFTDIPCRCCGGTITKLGNHTQAAMQSERYGYCWACWVEGRWAGDGNERW